MRNHFTCDFAESGKASCDGDESAARHSCDVTGDIPAVADDLFGFFRLVEVAFHHDRALDDEQSVGVLTLKLEGRGVDNFGAYSDKRRTDTAGFDNVAAHLVDRGGEIDGNNGREFSASVGFGYHDTGHIPEFFRDIIAQFLCSGDDHTDIFEIFRHTAAHIEL